jgi:hypothetical protein
MRIKLRCKFEGLGLCLTASVWLALAGCSGGGSDTPSVSPPVMTASTISGTAAAGLPLVGTVTVKDAKGATKSVPLSSEGGYSVDVSDMMAPFLFRAQGLVGARTYVIHSAATSADTNGTINITPLTDLIVSNVTGQVAGNYFNGGNFSGLSRDELDIERDHLKARLLPVLTSMGVDASIDLLRTRFTPLASALDKALDILNVSTDPATNMATITNLVNQEQLLEDLADKDKRRATTRPLPSTGMGESTSDDIAKIRKALRDFSDKFANGPPTPQDLLPLLSSTANSSYAFRHQDMDAIKFATRVIGDGRILGEQFTEAVIRKMDYVVSPTNLSPRAFVDFVIKDKDGVVRGRVPNFQFVKGNDGVWRMRGDGRFMEADVQVLAVKDAVKNCVSTGLKFKFVDANPNNSANVEFMLVTGPGLPSDGLTYQRSASSPLDYWRLVSAGQNSGSFYRLASTCTTGPVSAGLSDAQIAAIPEDAVYSVKALDMQGMPAQFAGFDIAYKERLSHRPLTLAEATTTVFPSISTSTPLATFSGGSISISATYLQAQHAAEFSVFLYGLIDQVLWTAGETHGIVPSGSGQASISSTITPPTAVLTRREVRVETVDAREHSLLTVLYADGN